MQISKIASFVNIGPPPISDGPSETKVGQFFCPKWVSFQCPATPEEVSAKVRTGGPIDDEDDYALDIWAGVLPSSVKWGKPVPDDRLDPSIPIPRYLSRYSR